MSRQALLIERATARGIAGHVVPSAFAIDVQQAEPLGYYVVPMAGGRLVCFDATTCADLLAWEPEAVTV